MTFKSHDSNFIVALKLPFSLKNVGKKKENEMPRYHIKVHNKRIYDAAPFYSIIKLKPTGTRTDLDDSNQRVISLLVQLQSYLSADGSRLGKSTF